MKKPYYIKFKHENAIKLEILNAESILDAIRSFSNNCSDEQKISSIILITSQLEELTLKQKMYNYKKPILENFTQMGKLILGHFQSEFDFDEAVDSKRLTSKRYKRHLAALTLQKNGKYHSTFTYTYSIISQEQQIVELRFLSLIQATFVICRAPVSDNFLGLLNKFVELNSEKEERLNEQFGNGEEEYKRHSDYFDYEFKYSA